MIREAVTYDQLRGRLTPDMLGILCSVSPRRIGVLSWMTFMEYRHFKPGTPANRDFTFAMINWEGMRLALVIIPRIHRPQAEWMAKQLGLRIANGVPHVLGSTGEAHFPIDVPNLFTLENVAGHFVYQNRPDLNKTAEDFEDEAVARETGVPTTKTPARPNEPG